MLELAVLKLTLYVGTLAWGVVVVSGDLCAASLAAPVLLLLAAQYGRVDRLRGKRAEGPG